ncbi:MAG: ABC transporter ATP-binding protein [Chloroflexi bacterium]|nr:ABC transporter ATP-binding protein [Chloroflexota bacterium]
MAAIFDALDTEAYDRQYTDSQLLRRIASYMSPQRRRIIGVALFTTGVALIDVVQPFVMARAVNALAQRLTLVFIFGVVAIILFSRVFSWLLNYFRRRLSARAIGDLVMGLRLDAFRAAAGHDLSFYDEFKTGRILSRITSDTQDFAQTITLITDLFSQILVIAILSAVLLAIEWRLTLMLLGFAPLVVLLALSFRRLARFVTRQGTRAMANVNAAIRETIAGIVIAKNFRQERTVYDEFTAVNAQSYAINLRRGFVLSNLFPVLNGLAGVGTATLVYFGGLSAAKAVVSVGSWYLFIASLDRFWFPLTNLAAFWSQFQAGLSAAERVFALIDAEPRVAQTDPQPAPALRGDINFVNMGFTYAATRQETVLADFSLHVRAGESVALVGHTGAGKSSIARLIARFYEFQRGQLLIDGRDIRAFDLASYRRQLGIVSQAPFLFEGTVADNIRYARPATPDADIETLARKVGHGEWLEALPDGLNTEVGERGAHLSMGQRQLVSLMRVLAQKPAIFILDEATASVDPFTESQIQEALDLILAHSTSILIAHRLSTVRAADRIIVLKQGAIIEEGNHTGLMAQDGHYAELYNTYFRHQSLEAINAYGRLRARGAATPAGAKGDCQPKP